jgi:nondiscriminating glutamyl-tRNA synthetase
LSVRVRFAPSPTGFLHLGGARTALLNWLFARKHGGKFILRIEDTDTARERPEFREEIFHALRWLGIQEDEGPTRGGAFGPYAQSERTALYTGALKRLKATRAVYPCFCVAASVSETETMQKSARCVCGNLTDTERSKRESALSVAPALRMRVDQTVIHRVRDLIRGDVAFPAGEVEDFIVAKAGGAPLYNFAAVVDDAAMQITHVIRGEEHLANTPKQILLYDALGYPVPQFAHLPIILNTERHKLSKRDGATAVSDYEKSGFLPEALCNFLALLGWSPGGDREMMTQKEMIELFDLARVQKHAAVFDVVKLTWMNGEYLKKASLEEVTLIASSLLAKRHDAAQLRLDPEHIQAVCKLLHARVKTVAEITSLIYFFTPELKLDWNPEAVHKRASTPEAHQQLAAIAAVFANVSDFTAPSLEAALRAYAEEKSVKAGDIISPLRVAVTGLAVSPGIFETVEVLGRDIVLGRVKEFLAAHPLEVAS